MNTNHEKHLNQIRAMITGDSSRVGAIWKDLRTSNKELLLMSAGLSPRLASRRWQDLNDQELRALYHGYKKLKILVGKLSTCREQDFRSSPQNFKSVHQPQTHNTTANSLHEKAALLSQLKH